MLNLPFAALLLGSGSGMYEETELFMPAKWFGIIMFVVLLLILLTTVAFANKGKELPAREHEDH